MDCPPGDMREEPHIKCSRAMVSSYLALVQSFGLSTAPSLYAEQGQENDADEILKKVPYHGSDEALGGLTVCHPDPGDVLPLLAPRNVLALFEFISL